MPGAVPWHARSLDLIPAAGNGKELGAQGMSRAKHRWQQLEAPILPVSHPQLQEEMISELCGSN